MYRPINPLSLTATLGDPNPALSHGRAMQSGVHLRWAFDPEFGYPEGGFELYRSVGESIDLIYKWIFEKTLPELIQDHNQSGYWDNWIQKIPSNIKTFYDQLRKLEPRYQLANSKPLDRFSHALLLNYENQDHKKHKALIGVLIPSPSVHFDRFLQFTLAGIMQMDLANRKNKKTFSHEHLFSTCPYFQRSRKLNVIYFRE